jgi:hypothetical protein
MELRVVLQMDKRLTECGRGWPTVAHTVLVSTR